MNNTKLVEELFYSLLPLRKWNLCLQMILEDWTMPLDLHILTCWFYEVVWCIVFLKVLWQEFQFKDTPFTLSDDHHNFFMKVTRFIWLNFSSTNHVLTLIKPLLQAFTEFIPTQLFKSLLLTIFLHALFILSLLLILHPFIPILFVITLSQ